MKKLFLIATTILSFQLHAQDKAFTINGEIRGNADGKRVTLSIYEGGMKEVVLDSTVIKDGKFVLKGSLQQPERCQIVVNNTPEGKDSGPQYWLRETFFLENSDIHFSTHIDSMRTYYWNKNRKTQNPAITGSYSEDIHQLYKNEVKELQGEMGRINTLYLQEYHIPASEGKLNTKKGIELARQMNEVKEELDKKQLSFIEKYYNTAIAYELAQMQLGFTSSSVTNDDINRLESAIMKGFSGTPKGGAFAKMAAVARNFALGTRYKDFELLAPEGKKMKVSRFMKPGKITLLEFWASWCGPCRAEIPHLKHLKSEYGSNFQIIGISLDEKDAAWKKALKDENMAWAQLNDPKAFEGEYAKAYNIQGIPYSLLLDGKGKILQTNLRGAQLDMVLEDMRVPKAVVKPSDIKKPVKAKTKNRITKLR